MEGVAGDRSQEPGACPDGARTGGEGSSQRLDPDLRGKVQCSAESCPGFQPTPFWVGLGGEKTHPTSLVEPQRACPEAALAGLDTASFTLIQGPENQRPI